MAITGPSMNEAINGSKDKPDDKEVDAIAPVIPDQRVVSDYKAAGRLPPLPGNGDVPAGLPTSLPGDISDFPTGAPLGLPPLPGGPITESDRPTDPLSISRVKVEAPMDIGQNNAAYNQYANTQGLLRLGTRQENRELDARWNRTTFRPVTYGEAVQQRGSIPDPVAVDMSPVYQAARQNIVDNVQTQNRLREDNFKHYWFNTLQPYSEHYFAIENNFKPEAGFDSERWMRENNVDAQALGNVRDGKYWEEVYSAKSSAEAAYWFEAAKIRHDSMVRIQADGLGTQLALGMAADIANPVHLPLMVAGPVAIGAMRSTGVIGRMTLRGTTTASQVAGGVSEELISAGAYVAAQAAVGEIRTVNDVLLEMGTGAVLGGVGSAITSRGAKEAAINMQNEYVRSAFRHGVNAVDVAEKKIEYARRAADELGPNASDDMLTAKIGQYEREDIDDVMRISLADLPDKEKLIMEFTEGTREAERIKMLESALENRDAINKRNQARIKKQQEVEEYNRRADEIDAANQDKYEQELSDYNDRMMLQRSEEAAAAARDANSGVANEATDVADVATVSRTVDDGVDPMTSNELPDPGITATVDNSGNLDFTIPDTLRRPGVEVHTRGTKKFDLEFDNDLDRAAMMLNSSRKAKASVNTELRELITNHGLDPKAVSSYGRLIRDRLGDHIKKNNLASGANVRISDLVTDADRIRHFGPDAGKPKVKPAPGPRIDTSSINSIRDGYRLSVSLSGAKPRYKQFDLVFDNDFDRAAYVIGNSAKSKHEASYIKSLTDQGISPAIAREHGRYIRERIKSVTGNEQSGEPIIVSALLDNVEANKIVSGASAKVKTRAQAAAERKLAKPPVEPKPAPRKTLSPDDLRMEKELSMVDINNLVGINERFSHVSDIREALQLQLMDERINNLPIRQRSEEKNKLAEKLTKMMPGIMGDLNPIATKARALSHNPIMLRIAEMFENPTGSTWGKTATLTKHMLEKQFMGSNDRVYQMSIYRYYGHKGLNGALKHIDTRHAVEFNNKAFLFQTNKANGKPELNRSMFDEVEYSILDDYGRDLDRMGDMMRRAQIHAKVDGYENLPDNSIGYLPWRVSPDKWLNLGPEGRSAYINKMIEEVQKANPEISADEAYGLSKSWANVMTNKAGADLFITTSPFSRRGASEIEQAIRDIANMTEDQRTALLSKYKKGQLNHTKTRIRRDLSAEFFVDKDGNKMMLMDIMETDPIALMRSQSGRVAGEISVRQFGINGRAGFENLRKIAATYAKSSEELELFDQMQATLLGLPTFKYTDGHRRADTFLSVLRSITLGKLVFAQVGEIFNSIPLIGITGALRVIGRTFSAASDAKKVAKGIKIDNSLIEDLDKLWGGVGTDNYKHVLPVGETGREFDVPYSATNLSLLARFGRGAENLQAKYTFFHGVLAAQQRLIAEEIVRKSADMVRTGKNNKALMSMGIHPDLAAKLRNEVDVFEYDNSGKLVAFNPLRARDSQAVSEYVQGIRRGMGQIIQETFDGERGDWISSPFWKLALALRSFVLTSFQKQLVRTYTDMGAIQTLGYITGAAMMITPIQIAKTYVSSLGMSDEDKEEYLDRNLSPGKLAFASISYTASGGVFTEAASVVLAPFDTGLTNVRSGGGGRISALSPALGLAENAWNFTGDVIIGRVNKDGETVRKPEKIPNITPGGNIIGVKGLVEELLGSDND